MSETKVELKTVHEPVIVFPFLEVVLDKQEAQELIQEVEIFKCKVNQILYKKYLQGTPVFMGRELYCSTSQESVCFARPMSKVEQVQMVTDSLRLDESPFYVQYTGNSEYSALKVYEEGE